MSIVPQCDRFKPFDAAPRLAPARSTSRLTSLVLGLSSALALAPEAALCTTRVVSSCADDGGVGTLRHQVGAAASGDTIDLSTAQLTCSTVTLDAGAVAISQAKLDLVGPYDRAVTIAIPSPVIDRVFNHTGGSGGRLYIRTLTVSGGYSYSYDGDAKGGCISSDSYVRLEQAVVTGCKSISIHGVAAGGGVFAPLVAITNSFVQGNAAYASSHDARGGGVAGGELILANSTLSGNSATSGGSAGGRGLGGGTYIQGSSGSGTVVVYYSTIDSNHAAKGAGIFQRGLGTLRTINSTISGNTATIRGGGIDSEAYYAGVYNSTVAFNSAPNYAGMYVNLSSTPHPFRAYSSIIARNANTSPSGFADVYLKGQGFEPNYNCHNNLIISYNIVPPAGVIVSTADPQLAPLAMHGGRTRTHALLPTSPAIDAGASPFNRSFDQRLFPRVVNGTADIGAYERQLKDDEIFYSGFD